jgi:excinuclease ABC subunit B
MPELKVHSPFQPSGDQPSAINDLVLAVNSGNRYATLLGATGTGKTFTISKVIEATQKPALIIAHNKTLAAQLYAEFKEFFPENAVEYFVSYYDYYQPEAYVAKSDLYIEKDSSINDEIDRLRLAATSSLMSRRDVIIVASVSCIYGVGNPEDYGRYVVKLQKGEMRRRELVLRMLVAIQYERNDIALTRGRFRVRGDTLEVQPAYAETAYRLEFFGDEVERLTEIDTLTGEILNEVDSIEVYPAKHYITAQEKMQVAIKTIEAELEERIATFKHEGKLLEAQRIEQRTRYDLEMMREVGFTSGIENYSRHLDGRTAGTPPFTLLDYFPDDFLLVIDESHMTLPQISGMYNGDHMRKQSLVDYGFRLPSALDNRPLKFDEFEQRFRQVIYVSATPGPYELKNSPIIAEQVIRPTGIVDPEIEVKPVRGQVDDLIAQIRERTARHERVLVTTLTKRMAEDLTQYLLDLDIKVQYLHSEVQTVERVEILRDLRLGEYDVVVGINLLREGLDLPEVSLVAILDADKEGFLRSGTSLIQTVGRAARHVAGKVIMYADKMTDSMKRAIDETNRRRAKQVAHNVANNIEPISIYKAVRDLTDRVKIADDNERYGAEDNKGRGTRLANLPKSEVRKLISELDEQMRAAAKSLEFEMAAMLRDQILELRQQLNDIDDKTPEWEKIRRMGDEIVEDELAAETAKSARAAAAGGGAPKPAIYRRPSKAKPGRARERSVKTSRR